MKSFATALFGGLVGAILVLVVQSGQLPILKYAQAQSSSLEQGMTLEEFRIKYPQYNDLSDSELADALHKKFYTDMPIEEFYSAIDYDPNTGDDNKSDSSYSVQDVLKCFVDQMKDVHIKSSGDILYRWCVYHVKI